jgi:hypothetical protein
MIDRPYRTMAKLLSRAGLGLGLLVPLVLAACGTSRAAGKAGLVTDAPTPHATLGTLRTTPTPDVQSEKTSAVARTPTPTAALDVRPVTPTLVPASQVAPDFQLPDLDGATWTLSQFRGQPVMLFFWATW